MLNMWVNMTMSHMLHIYFKYARRAYASRVSGQFSGRFSGWLTVQWERRVDYRWYHLWFKSMYPVEMRDGGQMKDIALLDFFALLILPKLLSGCFVKAKRQS
jgi:aromatic ring-cleaving dioxygenase